MKRFIKNITTLLLIPAMLVGVFVTSCKKDNSGGTPKIQLVRVTNPLKSDSLLTGAYLGNLIVLVGENLSGVKEIWFNDRKANLNPTYITDNNVFVSVPNDVPNVVSNQIKMVFGGSDTLSYPFNVLVPAPKINSLKCEYVATGDSAVIYGDYFYDPEVYFTGTDKQATIVNFSKTMIQVTVPPEATIGPITVKNRFGKMASAQVFRDDRGIFLNFDSKIITGSWQNGKYANADPTGVSGNYVKFTGAMAGGIGSTWDEGGFAFHYWPSSMGLPKAPLYTGDLTKAVLRFELNVYKAWSASALQMFFISYETFGKNSYLADNTYPRAVWIPWQASGSYMTNGWITVSVPLSEFKYGLDGKTNGKTLTPDMLYGCSFFVWNGGVKGTDCTPGLAIDNIRIVPIQ